ncbi:MAG: hypothetical protein NT050_01245 [Verrucomicrobia bacterium]|nr:hypothetical protein [Verrucomicrobiota bacterium]
MSGDGTYSDARRQIPTADSRQAKAARAGVSLGFKTSPPLDPEANWRLGGSLQGGDPTLDPKS